LLCLVLGLLVQWGGIKRFLDHRISTYPFLMQINTEEKAICENVVNSAIRRASKWISYQLSPKDGEVMIGQVGGVSAHKRPLLTLEPDYVMKPVHSDHRGIREICLYEAVKVLTKTKSSQTYAALLTGGVSPGLVTKRHHQQTNNSLGIQAIGFLEFCDTLAMWLAMKMHDSVVVENEQIILSSWKAVKKEIETLRRLATFTPPYYGVVGQRSPLSMPHGEEEAHKAASRQNRNGNKELTKEDYGVSLEAHLLLTDVTANFSKPCVMDIKMGAQSYEPDAPKDKVERERGKYPMQSTFGFRIVGMRFYDPDHPDADENGYRFFNKQYGRSLETSESVLEALRLFFSSGCIKQSDQPSDPKGNSSLSTTDGSLMDGGGPQALLQERVRTRSISSILAQIRPIQGFFEENKTFCFYSSSLLIVFEGNRKASNPDMSDVKMIDFGRVRREAGGDQGYRLGLRTLKSMMDKILKEEKQWLQSQ
jgi:hypothetical protein